MVKNPYWCFTCKKEIFPSLTEYKCPLCKKESIEPKELNFVESKIETISSIFDPKLDKQETLNENQIEDLYENIFSKNDLDIGILKKKKVSFSFSFPKYSKKKKN